MGQPYAVKVARTVGAGDRLGDQRVLSRLL
jgi:hypothetical protein